MGIAGVVTLAVLLVPSQLDSDGPPAVIEHELVVDTELIQDDLTPGSELLQDDPIPSSEVTVGSEVSSITSSVSGQLASRGLSDRIDIWKDSWRLMVHRPWFELESLDLSVLRPLIGYGPEMFRYTYLLESPPLGERLIPRESLHAHNYLLHQGVETGFLGLLASLGVLVVPMLLGGYLLVWRRRDFSTIHKLLLAGLVATLVGRFLEQLFGLARVSDLTMFWVLLAIFAALPLAMGSSLEGSQPRVGTRQQSTVNWWQLGQFLVVAFLIGVIGTLTWVKTINYPRAGVIAANAGKQSNDGNLGDALSSIDRAIALAPDVWINYNRRAAIYFNYRNNLELPKESRCRLRADGLPYQACLTTEAYLGNLEAVQQRPYNFRAHYTLARSAFALANLKGDQQLETDALRFYGETAALVPTAWPLFNQLASSYLNLGQTEAAFGPLEKSLGITSGSPHSAKALLLRGVAYINLGQY